MKKILSIATSKNIVTTALKICFIVGTALNLINQFEAISTFAWQQINVPKLFLTYSVPYLVSTYAGTAALLKNMES